MLRKSVLALTLVLSVSSYAGQEEYARESTKAKLDHDYVVKLCYKKPVREQKECLAEVNQDYAIAVKGLRDHYLGKGWNTQLGRPYAKGN